VLFSPLISKYMGRLNFLMADMPLTTLQIELEGCQMRKYAPTFENFLNTKLVEHGRNT